MTATTETKPKRETWRAWLPDGVPEPDLVTRDELVAILASWRLNVSVGDLRYWEHEGIIPKPIRQWHEGAVRALYPAWFKYVIRELRRLQRVEGLRLEQIQPQIRTYTRLLLAYEKSPAGQELAKIHPRPMSPEELRIWPDLMTELEQLARWWTHLSGIAVDRVEVHVIGSTGRVTKYPIPLASESEEQETARPSDT